MGNMSQSDRLVSVTPAFTDIVVNIEVEGVLPQSKSQSKVQSPKSEDLEWLYSAAARLTRFLMFNLAQIFTVDLNN